MTRQEIKLKAPSVFATSPSPGMSKNYVFVPTFEVVEKFEQDGWNVSSVKQSGKTSYGLHEIRMRNGGLPKVGDSLFEAVIKNSHNGSSKFSLSSGLFRLVCSNGLTVPLSVSESFNLKHMNFEYDDVKRLGDDFSKKMPIIQNSMDKMMNRELTIDEKIKLTKEALKIRFQDDSVPTISTIESILVPNRNEDSGDDLWSVFNVIQEKFVGGGFKFETENGRKRSTKAINNIINSNKLNTKLWELAETMC